MNLAELNQAKRNGALAGGILATGQAPFITPGAARALHGQLAATSQGPDAPGTPQARTLTGGRRGWRRAVAALLAGLERARQRRRLMALDDRMLKDVGLSRSDAAAEYGKPFWR
ncbi:MAG: DUF1127 domain-containing protein [Candidatus Lambdaproteobacteria bacterium]|nr:DUF1127 domain-containing protein [Candidatus Lambdaproteobacteria bacterium]